MIVGTTTISNLFCAFVSVAISHLFSLQSVKSPTHFTSAAEFQPALKCTTVNSLPNLSVCVNPNTGYNVHSSIVYNNFI